MRILIATDAWHPQVNGVVRTLTSLQRSALALGADIRFLTPEGFPSMELPTYPGLRVAWPKRREIARRIEEAAPEAIHIATEGPIGWSARAYCRRRSLAFTTSYTTRFPEYIAVRSIVPASVSYAVLRHFHNAAATTMVAVPSLYNELAARGFRKLGFWGRGVDTELFNPDHPALLDLPRPIFMTMGRVAVEKNIEAFLSLDLPGSKVVVGGGPQLGMLQRDYPKVLFTGPRYGEALARAYAGADVFVFPSLTDTFGLVILEALACGTPVAAFPVTGPKDVLADAVGLIGAVNADLRLAALAALEADRAACRAHAERYSWRACAEIFLSHLVPMGGRTGMPAPAVTSA